MEKANRYLKITSAVMIITGLTLLILTIFLGRVINFALPMVFLMLGGFFFILVFLYSPRWKWAVYLFLPGSLLLALGLIFLLNVLTNDWNSWAYAWLLLFAGAGMGLSFACWYGQWRHEYHLIGVGLMIGGVTLFALFGAIAGGAVIQIMAPVLLALGGLILSRMRLETLLPDRVARRFNLVPPVSVVEGASAPTDAAVSVEGAASAPPELELQPQHTQAVVTALPVSPLPILVEPLSARELEVLRLIDQGLSNQEIASRLVVAQSTVKTHINNIYSKLGVQTRVQAVRSARDLGLI